MRSKTTRSASKTAAKSASTRSASTKSAKSASKTARTKSASTKSVKSAAKSASQTAAKSASKTASTKSASTKSAAKSASKTAAKSASKPAAKSSTKLASTQPAKSPSKSAGRGRGPAPARDGDAGPRTTAAAARVIAWLQRHAELPTPPAGASAARLAAFERTLGASLPPDLAAWWGMHDGGVPIFEYAGLDCAGSARRRQGLEKLRRAGTFDDHELFEQSEPRIAAVKWHTGWIPLAEDGCGNLYCVDLAPGLAGRVGQVLRWEVRGGGFAASSVGLATLLERYADALESGRFVYQPDSGTFYGPFLDLLRP